MRILAIGLSFLFFPLACTAQKELRISTLQLDDNHTLVLADSAEASVWLTEDRMDRFFELITASEMSIQMKQPLREGQSRTDLLPEYRAYLRKDVESFDREESVLVAEVLQEAFKNCKELAPDIFPDTLIIIKTKGKHYGPSVYYTRENKIIIPRDVLDPEMRGALLSTIYHELFHVYARMHPDKRTRLYRLIGFEHIGLNRLRLPDSLAARVLYNPDGVDFAQKITLDTGDGKTIDAVPMIYSRHVGFQPGKRSFFGYVEFNLFQIAPNGPDGWKVLTKSDGYTSTLNLQTLPDFFRQIKENTEYIIHPDEILADNFSFLFREKAGGGHTRNFRPEGKKLLAEIEAVIKN